MADKEIGVKGYFDKINKAEIAYMNAKNALFGIMHEIITELATNKVFRERSAYSKYLSFYEAYAEARSKYLKLGEII